MRELLARDDAPVIALGGGALASDATRGAGARARVLRLARRRRSRVAWERVDGAPGARPLAGDRAAFEQLQRRARAELYRAAADAIVAGEESAESVAGALAQQVWTRAGHRRRLALGEGAVAIVDRALALARDGRVIELEGGEEAKSPAALERLWRALAEPSSSAATWSCAPAAAPSPTSAASPRRRSGAACPGSPCRRRWSARSTRRSAARRRSTSPPRTTSARSGSRRPCSATPTLLETLPPREWAGGMAEVVKTGAARRRPAVGARRGLGAGHRRASPRAAELVQRCAGVKTLVVAADPEERGRRAILNLGHTIGHGIEAVAGYGGLSHGECVVDRPGRRAAPLGAARRPRRPAPPSDDGGAARAPRAARACARARPATRCSRPCATTRSARPGRTGWCCWRRSGGPSTASRSTSGARRRRTRRHRSPLD